MINNTIALLRHIIHDPSARPALFKMTGFFLAITTLIAIGSANSDTTTNTSDNPERTPHISIDWGTRYSTTVRDRITSMTNRRDCRGLQRELDAAYANDAITRARTGTGTADLMQYITTALEGANCQ